MNFKENNAITLIKLIISIVVLIFLLTVGIYFKNKKSYNETSSKENNNIQENTIVEENNAETNKSEKTLEQTVKATFDTDGKFELNKMKDNVKSIGGEVVIDNEENNILVKFDKQYYIIKNNGEIKKHLDIDIDGKNTDNNEYSEENLIYKDENNNAKLYLKENDGYMNLFIEDDEIDKDNNIQILLSNTTDSTVSMDYKYAIEGNKLYTISKEGTISGNTLLSELTSYKQDALEYKIPLSKLNIQSIKEIREIKVIFKNANWKKTREYICNLIKNTY